MDLLAFERKLDATIMRKRLDIQEALKRPLKVKKKLRIFISNTFYAAKHEETVRFVSYRIPRAEIIDKKSKWFFLGGGGGLHFNEFNTRYVPSFTQDGEESVASWELRVEGRLLDEVKYKQCYFENNIDYSTLICVNA